MQIMNIVQRHAMMHLENALGQAACELDELELGLVGDDQNLVEIIHEAYEDTYSAMCKLANLRTGMELRDKELPKFGASCTG
jgi:hypothetical protein